MSKIRECNYKDYQGIFSLSEFAFQYTLTEEEMRNKQKELDTHTIWGWFDHNKLAAKVHVIPFAVHLHGKKLRMGGVAAVASWPEHRRGGKIKQLLKEALSDMKTKGQTISYLHPFSIPFYRKYGWEVTFAKQDFQIPISHFSKTWNGKGDVRRAEPTEQSIEQLNKVYTSYIDDYTGSLYRDGQWWQHRIFDKKQTIAFAYNESNVLEGYIIYNVKERKLTIKDMAFSTLNGRKLIYQFLSNHDSMVDDVFVSLPEGDPITLLVDEPRFKQSISPYFMSRIVDVEQFLTLFPFRIEEKFQPFVLKVEDTFLEENNGYYEFNPDHLRIDVTKLEKLNTSIPLVSVNIQQLSSIMLNYRRPTELRDLEMIKGDVEAVQELDKILPNQTPYFPDFF
ncbi:GNAT family N-acetyltransferase [Gracilibacillus kekensis]|uniref:Predicted acetyltransferase n=1 Tax=Gracilibacillus kekensis TaxID=1027249 RepID=A0A1M7QZ36_9BACI|nr:GNAT family N-acetyltransferase [Gracilibacillus kekensis]SHN37171.1 Predicted acetyltransferase [Gracilibacillus kekensis]